MPGENRSGQRRTGTDLAPRRAGGGQRPDNTTSSGAGFEPPHGNQRQWRQQQREGGGFRNLRHHGPATDVEDGTSVHAAVQTVVDESAHQVRVEERAIDGGARQFEGGVDAFRPARTGRVSSVTIGSAAGVAGLPLDLVVVEDDVKVTRGRCRTGRPAGAGNCSACWFPCCNDPPRARQPRRRSCLQRSRC